MNKKIYILLSLLLPLFLQAQQLTIKGVINGLADGSSATLTDLENGSTVIAKTKTRAGAFVLSAKLDEARVLGLSVGDNLQTALFVNNDNVVIAGDAKKSPDNWKITGSKTQDEFTLFQKTFYPGFQALEELEQQLQAGGGDSLMSRYNKKVQEVQLSTDAFVVGHPQSPVSAMAILSTMGMSKDIAQVEKRAALLQPAALNTTYGGQLKNAIIEAKFNAIGSIALNFSQTDTSGNKVSLSQFRGKYVLVDFWASWCGPCRQENHFLVKTYNKFKDKNFTVLGVSLDEDKAAWLRAIKKDALTWTHVSDLQGWENAVAQQYKIRSIPRNVLIGPDGKIIAKDLRGDALDQKLGEVLGSK